MENILIIGIIIIFILYLYSKFKKEYMDGSCTNCASGDECGKKK